MENFITDELMEKTFLYCYKRVSDKDEANDLAQEIVIDGMLILRSGKKIKNFYGLYWQIAHNKVTDFYRKKRPTKISLDDVENSLLGFDKSIGDFINQEELDNLSKSMTKLANIHRDILVRYYIKNQSVKEISDELELPIGTVTWRLSEARTKLKENFKTMENRDDKKKTSSKIVDFKISWYGQSWTAYQGISSLIDKQILFYCRNDKKSVAQLSKLIDIPIMFLEDNIKKLCDANVLFEVLKGKYLTDFTIFPSSVVHKAYENASKIANKINLQKRYIEILLKMKDEILSENFYGKDLPWEYLLPYFIIRSDREFSKQTGAEYMRQTYGNQKNERYWRNFYLYGTYENKNDYKPKKDIIGSGYNYEHYISSKIGHYEIHNTIKTMDFKKDGKEYSFDESRLYWLTPKNVDLYLELTKNPQKKLNEKEQEQTADLLSKNVLKKSKNADGKETYIGMVPIFTFAQIDKWCKIWQEKFNSLAIEYTEALYQAQKDTVLPYIRKDLLWASINFFFPFRTDFDSLFIQYGIDKNLVQFEEGNNENCAGLVILTEKI